MLQDNLEAVDAGYSACTVTGDTIQFDSHLPATFVARQFAESEDRERSQAPPVYLDARSAEKDLAALKGKVKINRNSTLTYRVTDQAFSLFFDPDPPTLFPANLQVGPYTWGQFDLFWKYLKSLADLRRFLLAMACKQLGGKTTAHNSGALSIGLTEFKKMNYRVGLRYVPARAILEDMTYSPETAKDVIYQPLITLGKQIFVTAPLLIHGSNHERNFLVLVDRLQHRAKGAQAIKGVREGLMIEELRPLFEKVGLYTKERLRLGTGTRPIGDIDLLVWDKNATFALAISLKWLVGPDSVYEVRRYDERFKEALDIHRRCVAELETNKLALSRNFGLEPTLRCDTKILGIIVSKMGKPISPASEIDIPTVTSEELKIRITSSDLSALHLELARIPEQLSMPHGRSTHREFRLGDYKVRFPAFIADK